MLCIEDGNTNVNGNVIFEKVKTQDIAIQRKKHTERTRILLPNLCQ